MTTFKEKLEKSKANILVVDAINLAFRYKHQKATTFVDDYISTVYSLANSYSCGTIIITSDNRGSSYRREIFPEYKKNRDFSDQTEEEKEYFELFIQEYLRCLDAFRARGVLVLNEKGVEADDFAALVCSLKEELSIDDIWLISSDKDWDLLIEEGISRFSYVTRKEVTMKNFKDTYEVTPNQYISLKVLQGDSGDNIPGIPQVGPKRAIGLINQYGSAFDVFENCPLPGSYVYIKNVNQYCDRILLNYELMDLRTYFSDAIGFDLCVSIKHEIKEILK